ncbi:MAG: AAA family ATPase [bacterium]|nr:AAA family ATPase [bacterium]
MRLKCLELSGFKSFAKPVKMEFPAPISGVGVVGPNGSGKSNVVEAIRWVLGEQSLKSLRGKKGEDLIFNGSQTAPRLGKASVSLIFDNKGKFFPVDFDEVKITRKVFRDGANEYFLNGSQVRLKDIIEILSKVGLGTSSHHIISQGEADRILSASPKERRQMIEDALGLKIYQLRKQESERKLARTEENISQVEALRKEIQPHLRFLNKQVEKAREELSLRDELKALYALYFAAEEKYLNEEKEKISERRAAPKAELEKIERDLAELSEDSRPASDEAKNEIGELKGELSKIETEISALGAERNSLEREMGRFEGMIEMEEKKEKRTVKEEISTDAVYKFTNKLSESIDAGLRSEGLKETKAALADIREAIKSFLSGLGVEVAVKSSDLENLKKKKEAVAVLIAGVGEREKRAFEERAELERKISERREALRAVERERYEMEARVKELRAILSNMDIREESLNAQVLEFEREKREAVALVGEEALSGRGDGDTAPPADFDRLDARRKIERMKIKLEDSGAIGEDAVKEYEEVKNRDEFFEKELTDLTGAADSLRELLKDLEEKINSDFKEGIDKINKEFYSFFVLMFGGGAAELKVVASKPRRKKEDEELAELEAGGEDGEENNEEGVDVSVSLPKKRINSLDMLSGGERALTSIALLFAMSQVNPPPFLILDETDAALDEANSQRYGNMLMNLSEQTQLIVITHNRETMKQAGVLYGVTMGSDSISKLLSIKFTEAERMVK